jgi:hypothetical protein
MVLNTKKMEEQVFDEPRFEFLLYVNNIICQRGFNIRDYDENSQMLLSLMRLDNFRV